MTINEQKQALRKQVAALKRAHTPEALEALSAEALARLEALDAFLLLPIVQGDALVLCPYTGPDSLHKGAYDIWEPSVDASATDAPRPDLIIVPGIAFDRQLNRLGRGRGYYDRLLSDLTLPCIGLAFAFQLFDHIPVDTHDRRMTAVVTDTEVIEGGLTANS